METSLLRLCQLGQRLGQIPPEKVHYSPEGASHLARIEEEHFWFTVRRKATLQLLRRFATGAEPASPPAPLVGLDIGCGTGCTAVFLTELGLPTYGLDAYAAFAGYATEKRGAGFLQGDLFSIEPKAEFDFILLLDVLEHFDDDLAFLRQSLKCLKPGGVAIVTVPAFPWLWSAFDEFSEHCRRYTKRTFGALVQRLGSQAKLELKAYFYWSTLLPYMVSRLRLAERKMDPLEASPPRLLNDLFSGLLGLESRLLPFGGLPLGSSLFAVIRKGT